MRDLSESTNVRYILVCAICKGRIHRAEDFELCSFRNFLITVHPKCADDELIKLGGSK